MYISSPSTIIILQVRIGNPQLKRLLHRFILNQSATLGGRKPPYLGYVYIVRLFSFSWGPSHCEALSRSVISVLAVKGISNSVKNSHHFYYLIFPCLIRLNDVERCAGSSMPMRMKEGVFLSRVLRIGLPQKNMLSTL